MIVLLQNNSTSDGFKIGSSADEDHKEIKNYVRKEATLLSVSKMTSNIKEAEPQKVFNRISNNFNWSYFTFTADLIFIESKEKERIV